MDIVGVLIWLLIIVCCAAAAWWVIRKSFSPEAARIATFVVGAIALVMIVVLMLGLVGYPTLPRLR